MSEVSEALCILFILLVPLALAGLALINTGLSRSRSAAHSMMAALCVVGVAAVAYFVTGFAWQGYPGLASHTLSIFGKEWSWLGAGHFFLRGSAPGRLPRLPCGAVAVVERRTGGADSLWVRPRSAGVCAPAAFPPRSLPASPIPCLPIGFGEEVGSSAWARTTAWAGAFWTPAAAPPFRRWGD